MARIARVIAAGMPHHVTPRGNRRLATFFQDEDFKTYIGLMAEWCQKCEGVICACCLMLNHVHLAAVPETEDGLRRRFGEEHRRYRRMINFSGGVERASVARAFSSFPMDEAYLLVAARDVERNPVRANLVSEASLWPCEGSPGKTG